MIAYEDLVIALSNWRATQGLPVGPTDFLAPLEQSVRLKLPEENVNQSSDVSNVEVPNPIISNVPLQATNIPAQNFDGNNDFIKDSEVTEIGTGEYLAQDAEPEPDKKLETADIELIEEHDSLPSIDNNPLPPNQPLQEEPMVASGLNYGEETQFEVAPAESDIEVEVDTAAIEDESPFAVVSETPFGEPPFPAIDSDAPTQEAESSTTAENYDAPPVGSDSNESSDTQAELELGALNATSTEPVVDGHGASEHDGEESYVLGHTEDSVHLNQPAKPDEH